MAQQGPSPVRKSTASSGEQHDAGIKRTYENPKQDALPPPPDHAGIANVGQPEPGGEQIGQQAQPLPAQPQPSTSSGELAGSRDASLQRALERFRRRLYAEKLRAIRRIIARSREREQRRKRG